MVKKRRRAEEEQKPWCYFCDREFQDEGALILHQKSKHFKCEFCHRRLLTAKALAVHTLQVHKATITTIPDALPGRNSIETEVFGMAGIPPGMQRGGVMAPPEAVHGIPVPYGMRPGGMGHPMLPPPGMFAPPQHYSGMMPMYGAHYAPPPPYPPLSYPPGPSTELGPPQPLPPPPTLPTPGIPPPTLPTPGVPHPPSLTNTAPPVPSPPTLPPPVAGANGGTFPTPPPQVPPPPPALLEAPKMVLPPMPVLSAGLVWTDEEESMEERRAQLPQYCGVF